MSWEMVRLGDLTEDGFMFDGDWIESKDQDPSGEIRLIQLADIGEGYFIDKSNRFINRETSKKLKCTFLKKNDILIARMPDPLGRACLFPFEAENSYVTVVDVCVMRIRKEVDHKYVTYAINSPDFRNKLESQITGTTRLRISGKKLKELQIPLPPLPIQKRIAEILDAADALKRKDQQLLQKYDELAQAIFIDMFGDPVKNEKGWEVKKLGDLTTIRRGASPRPIDKFIGNEIPWIKIGDGTKGSNIYIEQTKVKITKEGSEKSVLLQPGSLIFANCGVSLGFARILKISGCIHDGWLSIEDIDDNILNKIFLLKYINFLTDFFRKTAPEGTQPNLNSGIMKEHKIILPPIELQNKFSTLVFALEDSKFKNIAIEKSSDNLFQTLIQKAFKGELVAE